VTIALPGRPWWRRLPGPAGLVLLAGSAAGLGYVAAAASTSLAGDWAPAVMLGAALLPLTALAVVAAPWAGMALVFLSIPVGDTVLPVLSLEVVQVVVVAVVALVVLRRLGEGTTPLAWAPPLWWLLGLVAWSVIALASAADSGLAARQTGLVVGELAFACAVVGACRSPRHARLLMGVFSAVGVVVAVTAAGAGQRLESGYGGALVIGRPEGVFNQPNELGAFCAMALMVAVGLAMGAETRRGRWLAGGAAALVALALLVSLSRGAWIGVALALLVLLAMLPEARRALAAAGVPLLVVALAVGAFAPSNPQVRVVGERARALVSTRNPYDDRPAIWAEAGNQITADPWTGQGPGSFPVVSGRATSETGTAYADHAHSVLLTFAAETGVPAAVFLLGLHVHVFLLARRAARRARAGGRRREAALIAGLATGLVTVAGQGMVDYTLRAAVILTAAVGLLGVLLAMARAEAGEPRAAQA
jgi:O-antigen ligase